MNIGFDHSAIDTYLATFFEPLLGGPVEQNSIYLFPGFRTDHIDIFSQGGMSEGTVAKAEAKKSTDRNRVRNMERQVAIIQTEHLFDQGRAKHLIGTHAASTTTFSLSTPTEVFEDTIKYGRIIVEHLADRLQLIGFGMIDSGRCQRHLFFTFFAHFVLGPILVLIVFLVVCNSTYTINKTICPSQNALFLWITHTYYPGQTLIIFADNSHVFNHI